MVQRYIVYPLTNLTRKLIELIGIRCSEPINLSSRVDGTKRRNDPPLTTISYNTISSCTNDGWQSFYFVHEPRPAVGVVRTIYRAAPAPCQTLYRIFDNKLTYNTLFNLGVIPSIKTVIF